MLNLILKQNFQNDSLLGNYKFIENFFIYLFNYYFSNKLSFYLPAGVSLFIDSKSGDNIQDWKIMIGCHSDELDINNRLDRWPYITLKKYLHYNLKLVSSQYGGLVYLVSPDYGGKIKIFLSNIVESPFFDLIQPETINDWNRRKQANGLWAELAGKYIIFSVVSLSFYPFRNKT